MEIIEGQTFAGYDIVAKLGQGGMGTVYKARQPMLNRLVALKVLAPTVAGDDATYVARFKREAAAAARLNHPNIVQVFAAGECNGTHFMACELVEGESLQAKLNRRGQLDAREALAVCVFVCQALKYAWDTTHMIHRDIKPENIFLSSKGEVKVGDLGLAKRIGSDATGLTRTGTTLGSPHYMSPEQATAEKDIDFRADMYSLGCTLYHMLTGSAPYNSKNLIEIVTQHIYSPPPDLAAALPGCPAPLARIVSQMLAKNRNERHASYDELIAELLDVRDLVRTAIKPIISMRPVAAQPPVPPPIQSSPEP